MKAPVPSDETERLEALRRYRVLDTKAEKCFDAITALASYICETPVALVSLVDERRQWFKSRRGMDSYQTSRDIAFCAHTILGPDLMIVPDATKDERFADNPLVTGELGVRFYAGAPLKTSEGRGIGALCVMDDKPRELRPEQTSALESLASQVMILLDFRRTSHDLAQALERVNALQQLLPICSYCKKVRDDDGYWESVESYFTRASMAEFSHGICPECVAEKFPEIAAKQEATSSVS